MQRYRHIFFDLDRTLYDFDRNNRETIFQLYQNFRLDEQGVSSFSEFHQTYRGINLGLWERYKKQEITKEYLNVTRFAETLKAFGINHGLASQFASEYIRISPLQVNLVPGTIEILEYLHPRYPLHIITNGFDEIQFIKIERCGLNPYFTHIIVSEDAAAQKPDRRIFDFAFEKTKAIPEESIYIGDDPQSDILGAKMACMDQVWLAQPDEVSEHEPTYRISNLLELKNIL
ncbi:MAG: YjjG family noncanonical pyrimidine nucleotidase [Bacteroides sp.]|nr:YjjG family noncanonical pyrimidine nucleotidase [Bacteroides sp.]